MTNHVYIDLGLPGPWWDIYEYHLELFTCLIDFNLSSSNIIEVDDHIKTVEKILRTEQWITVEKIKIINEQQLRFVKTNGC